jgi:dipeptidyl aminopeptidase/acylaminoacyl peptidase
MITARRVSKLLLCLVGAVANLAVCAADIGRPFNVRDSVQMSYFGNLSSSVPDLTADDAVISPDGKHILKITHRGDLERGVTEATLWMFEVDQLRGSIRQRSSVVAKPVPLLRMAAAANGLAGNYLDGGNIIFQPIWSLDGRMITFLGRDAGENRRIFQVDIASRQVRALTPSNRDVLAFASSKDSIAYLLGGDADLRTAWNSADPASPDIVVGTGKPLMKILYPHFDGNSFSDPLPVGVWRVRGSSKPVPVLDRTTGSALSITTRYTMLSMALSPDGHRLAVVSQDDTHGADPGSTAASLSYQVVELEGGSKTQIVPIEQFRYGRTGRYLASWSPDGQALVVSEAVLETGPAGRCIVAIVGMEGQGKVACALDRVDAPQALIMGLQWAAPDRIDLAFKPFRAPSIQHRSLLKRKGQWRMQKSASRQLALEVRESLNEPPKLFAVDLATGRDREAFDPNPQLAGLEMGTAKPFTWKDPRGRVVQGGLLLPSRVIPGKRYPLVVQTHGFDPGEFFKVGYSETSNAGRALLSRDIVVLQVKEPPPEGTQSWEDATRLGLDVYVAAIDELDKQGLIDTRKVGISGYSYTGWLVTAAISRDPGRFAAAAIANTDPVTLTGYFSYVDTPTADVVAESFVGARPYGEGLKAWMERVPTFSSEKITAPVLFSAADPWHLINFWDLYASLRDQRKPAELQFFRTGQHNITKPSQRFAHQQMIVDWFDFWLRDHEEPDPAKAGQYVRWRDFRQALERRPYPASARPSPPALSK